MMRASCHAKAHRKSILEVETAGAKALRREKTLVSQGQREGQCGARAVFCKLKHVLESL